LCFFLGASEEGRPEDLAVDGPRGEPTAAVAAVDGSTTTRVPTFTRL
jgi:hypothetical protein